MRIAVAATPAVALPTLNALLDSEHVLAFIITQPDRPAGRGLQLHESDVSQWAAANAIQTFKPETSEELVTLLADIDVLLTIGYGILLPSEVISAPTHGSLNLHFSLLPRWRGAAPVQRAIEAGDSLSGVTVFALDEGMDTGPIYSVKKFALDSDAWLRNQVEGSSRCTTRLSASSRTTSVRSGFLSLLLSRSLFPSVVFIKLHPSSKPFAYPLWYSDIFTP